MKYYLLFIACLTGFIPMNAQENEPTNDKLPTSKLVNLSTGLATINELNALNTNTVDDFDLANFVADCATDFFTVNSSGVIQQWSLIDNEISGGTTILEGSGTSLACVGEENEPVFYSSNFPDQGITYYDEANETWVEIPTTGSRINCSGHGDDLYYMEVVNSTLEFLYHYDGDTTWTLIDPLLTNQISVFDSATDSKGQVWILTGDTFTQTTMVKVFNKFGLVAAYPFDFPSGGTYGAFFLNETYYIGKGDFIIPIEIDDDLVQEGTTILFPNDNFNDMASCQAPPIIDGLEETIDENAIDIYPNPTGQFINVASKDPVLSISIYNLQGKMMDQVKNCANLEIQHYLNGHYIVKVKTKKGSFSKVILKQ